MSMFLSYLNFGVSPAATFLAFHPQDNNIIAIGKGYKDVHFEAKIATVEGINDTFVESLIATGAGLFVTDSTERKRYSTLCLVTYKKR
ncbi:hypothetical protein Tco_0889928 [Tanacetum coccineum]